ncbi:hypothetical protein ACIQM3_27810 [Streptomyces sp. NPDC091271]
MARNRVGKKSGHEIVEAVAAADEVRAVRAMSTHFDGIRNGLEPQSA